MGCHFLLKGQRARNVDLGIKLSTLGQNLNNSCFSTNFLGILCFSPEVKGRK